MREPSEPTPYPLCSQCGKRWDGPLHVEHRWTMPDISGDVGCGNRGYFRMVGDDPPYQILWLRDGRCRIWRHDMGHVYLPSHLPLDVDVAGIRMALTFQ